MKRSLKLKRKTSSNFKVYKKKRTIRNLTKLQIKNRNRLVSREEVSPLRSLNEEVNILDSPLSRY